MTALIGITGKQRAGKDSIAARLVEHHGFTRVAFADPLRATLLDLDPLVPIELDETGPLREAGLVFNYSYARLRTIVRDVGWEAAKGVREVRRLMQAHGAAIRDNVHPDVWANAGYDEALRLRAEGKSVVITDVRYLNELNALKGLGGAHFHVDRPGIGWNDTHASETELEPYYAEADYHLANTGTLEDLHALVDAILAP